MLGEAFGAIAALQQESLAGRDLRQRAFQVARLAGKNQRRKSRKLRLDIGQRLGVRIIRHLHDRLAAPGIRAPLTGSSVSTYASPNPSLRIVIVVRAEFIARTVGSIPNAPTAAQAGVTAAYIHNRPAATARKSAYSAASRA